MKNRALSATLVATSLLLGSPASPAWAAPTATSQDELSPLQTIESYVYASSPQWGTPRADEIAAMTVDFALKNPMQRLTARQAKAVIAVYMNTPRAVWYNAIATRGGADFTATKSELEGYLVSQYYGLNLKQRADLRSLAPTKVLESSFAAFGVDYKADIKKYNARVKAEAEAKRKAEEEKKAAENQQLSQDDSGSAPSFLTGAVVTVALLAAAFAAAVNSNLLTLPTL